MNMNLTQLSEENSKRESTVPENDLEKLIDICNSYGLNQEETTQLISQFKRGALFKSNNSFNDSLNQSLNQMTFSQRQDAEEYSFKHPKEATLKAEEVFQKKEWIYMSDGQNLTNREEPLISMKDIERLLQERFNLDKDLVVGLQEENKKLKAVLGEKDAQIEGLLQLKRQDTQIIIGLKDIISNLAITLQQKQSSFQEIHFKYSNIMENKVKDLSEMKSSTGTDFGLADISNTFQPGNSSRSKQSRVNNEGVEAGGSGKGETSEGHLRKGKQSSRIDIRKYKEMIENMRNNY